MFNRTLKCGTGIMWNESYKAAFMNNYRSRRVIRLDHWLACSGKLKIGFGETIQSIIPSFVLPSKYLRANKPKYFRYIFRFRRNRISLSHEVRNLYKGFSKTIILLGRKEEGALYLYCLQIFVICTPPSAVRVM